MKKTKFYKTNCFLYVLLVLIPFVGIIILWVFHKEKKKRTKIVLTIIFSLWMLLLVLSMTQDGNEIESNNETKQEVEEEQTENVLTAENIFSNKKLEDIKKQITENCLGEGEIVEDVRFEDGDLQVYIELVDSSLYPSVEDHASHRAGWITDEILEDEQIFDFWNTITIYYKDTGYITCGKDDILVSDEGSLYIDPLKLNIQ